MGKVTLAPMSDKIRQQLEKALSFIGDHLEEKITVVQVADYAGVSSFHFQRLFNTYFGETLSQYVLHRRLELAAKILIHQGDVSIADLANNLGFESHRAFSRAFKKQHNISPSSYRNSPNTAKLRLRKPNSSNLRGLKNGSLQVTVTEHSKLWINHKSAKCTHDGEILKENIQHVNEGFSELLAESNASFIGLASSSSIAYPDKPHSLNDEYNSLLYGGIYNSKQDDKWSADWLEAEAGLWAVCTYKGDEEYSSQAWNKLIGTWLPDSGYELRDTIHFSLFKNLTPHVEIPKEVLTHIYLPIKEQKTARA